MSLNGANTSSTHTIYVTKVETNATGGLVGVACAVCRRRCGGSGLSPDGWRLGARLRPPRHRAAHPGCWAFVIRKAAVQKYGGGALARLANGVAHFAVGGRVASLGGRLGSRRSIRTTTEQAQKNREAFEARR